MLLFCYPMTYAQNLERWELPITNEEGQLLPMSLAGGLNAPQLSAADLNNDGIQDLYIFDRVGNKHLTFLNTGITGTSSYRFEPSYAANFPVALNWVLLRDFDNDGIVDLFTFPNLQISGIMVHKGYYENDQLKFNLIEFDRPLNVLYFSPSSGSDLPIFVSNIDYPAIDDMDCDGDLDVLTFNSTGGYIELYENQSVERGFGLDTLIFSLRERCWGGLFESGNSNVVDLAPSAGQCFSPLLSETPIEVRHTGSTLLTFDADNDDDKDLILGDISFNSLNFLTNHGDCQLAWMNEQDASFPSDGSSVDLPVFPAAFYLDVNNDGVEEILVAPGVDAGGENKEVLWEYQQGGGEGLSNFNLIQKDWLVEGMVDLGENAYPCFIDFNQDELLDIVIGNGTFYEPLGARNAAVFLFENVGSAETPAYQLKEEDVFQLNQFSQAATNFAPTFGDLDDDGDLDALIGEINGQLFFARNTAGMGQPMQFAAVQYGYMGIDIGFNSHPQLIDVNEDGLLDILIGEQSGNINYFQNQGTKEFPVFESDPNITPNNMSFGGVVAPTDGLAFSGHSSPFLTKVEEELTLFVGNRIGTVQIYSNIEGNIAGTFTLEGEVDGIDAGAESIIALADIDQDVFLDLVVGNQRGGISLWKTPYPKFKNVSSTEVRKKTMLISSLTPNPASSELRIQRLGNDYDDWQVELYSPNGKRLWLQKGNGKSSLVPLENYPAGIYFIRVIVESQSQTEKVVILK